MKKKILKRIGAGLLGGIAISYIITIFKSLGVGDGVYYPCVPSFVERFGNEMNAVIIQTVLSAILGASFGAGSVIWEFDNWSLLKQTGIYFAIISATLMGVSYVCEWMEHSLKGFIRSFCIIFAIFVVIWIARYLFWKKQISRMQSKIEKGIE